MRVLTIEQGSEAWEIARKGRVTASMITRCLAGKNTKGRAEYMLQLILDLEGVADFRDSAPWFEKGKKWEKHALGWYQFEYEIDVRQTGFVLHPTYNWFGASSDGLIDPDGGLEIKYRGPQSPGVVPHKQSLDRFHAMCTKPIPRSELYQCQANMVVHGRQWWDYLNYWRSWDGRQEQGHVRRIERDEGMIKELEEAAMLFWRDTVRTYRQRTRKDFIVYPWDNWNGREAYERLTKGRQQ